MDADAYRDHLAGLLPLGLPWPREPDTTLGALLAAWADSLARVDARALELLAEANPSTTAALLADWEAAYGLPDACIGEAAQTTSARRAALLARILARGGQRPADYVAIAAALGMAATVVEYRPHSVESTVTLPLLDAAWAYAWDLHLAAGVTVQALPVDGTVAEPLASWLVADALLCLLRRAKPAHTHVTLTQEAT